MRATQILTLLCLMKRLPVRADRPSSTKGGAVGYGRTGCPLKKGLDNMEKLNGKDEHRFESTEYRAKCSCGYVITLYTQSDNYPEYYTNVGVVCPKCGEKVWFTLPVN